MNMGISKIQCVSCFLTMTSEMNILGLVYHVRWFSANMLKARRELELAANQAKPVNQDLYLDLTLTEKNIYIFFQKIESITMPIHHMKGQPYSSTYGQEKGVLIFTIIVGHPVVKYAW